jgi:hypothetical protein
MTKSGIVSLLALALAVSLSGAPAPNKAKTHGYALSGTVSNVDESRKSFAVRNAAGKETRLIWTDATTVVGGKIKAGARVTLRYLDKDGKHIATSVVVGDPTPAKTAVPVPVVSPSAK